MLIVVFGRTKVVYITPSGCFLIDESGNFLVDDFGNNLIT